MSRQSDRAELRWIEPGDPLPPITAALAEPNGLLAAGRDLSPSRLLEAYRAGVFPWYSAGQPVLWWSPDPRMVLWLDEFKISRSLKKTLRRVRTEGRWQIDLNRDFDAVMQACAQTRAGQAGTWITKEIRGAYGGLHRLGYAHSVEIREAGELIGGLYGVSIGRMFFGESMFALRTDASKCALAALVVLLRDHGFSVIDCQQATHHLASLGARQIARQAFMVQVERGSLLPGPQWSELKMDFPAI